MQKSFKNILFLFAFISINATFALAQDNNPAKIQPPFTSPAEVYSGVSGAGVKIIGDGSGGRLTLTSLPGKGTELNVELRYSTVGGLPNTMRSGQ